MVKFAHFAFPCGALAMLVWIAVATAPTKPAVVASPPSDVIDHFLPPCRPIVDQWRDGSTYYWACRDGSLYRQVTK